MKRPVYICGPTASGKSALALEVARALNGEIVNGDAFQLYRGMPVLTAAPTAQDLHSVKHHLYGVLDPSESCDAMKYRQMALPVIEDIQQRGKLPIIAGGSGLYLKFLSHGPSPVPSGNPALRAELEEMSLETLITKLRELDPVEAGRTDLSNRRFVSRAVEICLIAGQPCSSLRDRWETRQREIDASMLGLFIQRDREELHERINRRTHTMLSEGAVEEVRSLGDCSDGLAKAIGVPQIRALLAGQIDQQTCLDQISAATRQYAKRQETWFRREKWLKQLRCQDSLPLPLEEALRTLSNKL